MPTTARQFWDLMQRWKVPDASALELIGYAGKIGRSGTRPRFRFLPAHQQAADFMTEIDNALTATGESVEWLHRRNRGLGRRTPIEQMQAGGVAGMEKVLQILQQAAFRLSLNSR